MSCYNSVMNGTQPSRLTDGELVSAVGRLAGTERRATVDLIVHLAEFDARRLYASAGFPSTLQYCVEVLRLSEDAASNRVGAARAVRAFPVVIEMLRDGRLSPTTARMLCKHLTTVNQAELLAAASGRSKSEVEELLAHRFPQPEVAPSVRRIPRPPEAWAVATASPLAPLVEGADASGSIALPPASMPPPAVPSHPAPAVRPVAADRFAVRFTMGAATRDKLRDAQDLLGHAVRTGDLAEVFDRALTLLVDDLRRKKCAAARRPRPTPAGPAENSRTIPAAVRREVWRRDGGRCAFSSASGHRCSERRYVEFHHVQPYAAHGPATVDNIQLRCRAHNRYEAEMFFGPMREYGGVGALFHSGADARTASAASARSGTGGGAAAPPHANRGAPPQA
jgi:hypothetical protein